MTDEGEEELKNINICRFCEKTLSFIEFRGHCFLTGFHLGPAH